MVNARKQLRSRVPRLVAALSEGIVPDKERNPKGGPTGFKDSVINLGAAFRSLLGVA
jgi:hypothetical protein